jgi:hypothetical protein
VSLSTPDPGFAELVKTVQLGLLGEDLSMLGDKLDGRYGEIWKEIMKHVSI